ncbi:SET domain [Trypanosoma melophagium]|uniref:SET domain n=1 Tax=Trypanosoma melophagium TaxID=715481 RepID=UPI00351A6C69|nr:SET domain [Trypanosoma melophagium]
MLSSSLLVRAATTIVKNASSTTTTTTTTNTNSTVPPAASNESDKKKCHEAFVRFLKTNKANLDGVALRPSTEQYRGLIAMRKFREGTTVLSVPMHTLSITVDRLLQSEHLRSLHPPTLDDVRRLMTARSIKDPVLFEQVYLALLLAGERLNLNSFFTPYFDVLPYPAVDDEAVMRLHKDVLDPLQLVEWDDHQREWLTIFRTLVRRWGTKSPPIEVCYWAWRTVLSRMHMLPDRGLAPAELGSNLNYFALSTFERAERQTRILKRIRATIGSVFGNDNAAEDYRLVPTLVPLLDMTNHLSSGNVSVEVQPRGERGSCVELQAVREIESGEEIGFCFNRSQGPAFTLYRFGFLPV